MTKDNRGYDKNVFLAKTERRDLILLPGVGRFCLNGCNTPIQAKYIKQRNRNGKFIVVLRKAPADQLFCCPSCKTKYYRKINPGFYSNNSESIHCKIGKKVIADKIPYREITFYLKSNVKTVIRITSKDKNIWSYMERMCRYNGDSIIRQPLIEVLTK